MKSCEFVNKCGGCDTKEFQYDVLSKKKQQFIEKLWPNHRVKPIKTMDDPYGYRYKVIATFGKNRQKQIVAGTFMKRSHDIVDHGTSCLLEEKECQAVIQTIKHLMKEFKIDPYDEDRQTGYLRHVQLRKSHKTQEILVTLVVSSLVFKHQRAFLSKLIETHPSITSVVLNENRRHTSIVLGSKEKIIYGTGVIQDDLCGSHFKISSQSFFQVNPVQTHVLYDTAIQLAHLDANDTVLDAYCGIGTIGMIASRYCAHVVGVEANEAAIKDAVRNAKINHRKNINFVNEDASAFMMEAAVRHESYDVVFMDPPRSGSDERFLHALISMAPKRVVYISCGPDTQVRDVKYLLKHGYQVKTIVPVDMFPFTQHVETVVILNNKNSKKKDYVEIGLDTEDYYKIKEGN